MTKATLHIGSKIFAARLFDNASAQTFAAKLPMTITMRELNGNEKYFNMDTRLPTDSLPAGDIKAGDVMLYGTDCLVLFYDSFATSYSYTKLGHLEDTSGLADALGRRSVQVTWSLETQVIF